MVIEENELPTIEELMQDEDVTQFEYIERRWQEEKKIVKEIYEEMVEMVKEASQGSPIWRIMGLRDPEKFIQKLKEDDTKRIGIHWTDDPNNLPISQLAIRNTPMWLKGQLEDECLDFLNTFVNNTIYDLSEREITMFQQCRMPLIEICPVKKYSYEVDEDNCIPIEKKRLT